MSAGTVIGLAIALGTLIVTSWLGNSRVKHERSLADLSDARKTLTDGALALRQMDDALSQLDRFEIYALSGEGKPAKADELLEAALSRERKLKQAAAGLRIRLPQDHLVVISLDESINEADEMAAKVSLINAGCCGGLEEAASLWQEAESCIEAFRQHRDAYLSAAQKTAGSSL